MAAEPSPNERALFLRRLGAEPDKLGNLVLENYPGPGLCTLFFTIPEERVRIWVEAASKTGLQPSLRIDAFMLRQGDVVQLYHEPARQIGFLDRARSAHFCTRIYASTFEAAFQMFMPMAAYSLGKRMQEAELFVNANEGGNQ